MDKTTPRQESDKHPVVTLYFKTSEEKALFEKLERAGQNESRVPTAQVRHVLKKWAEGVR